MTDVSTLRAARRPTQHLIVEQHFTPTGRTLCSCGKVVTAEKGTGDDVDQPIFDAYNKHRGAMRRSIDKRERAA